MNDDIPFGIGDKTFIPVITCDDFLDRLFVGENILDGDFIAAVHEFLLILMLFFFVVVVGD